MGRGYEAVVVVIKQGTGHKEQSATFIEIEKRF